MSLRPRRPDPPHAVQIHNQLAADPLYAHAAAVATSSHLTRGLSFGASSVPDIAEHNALEVRVAALEQGDKDMGARLSRVEARLEKELSELKRTVAEKITTVESDIKSLMTQKIGTIQTQMIGFGDEFASMDARINNILAQLSSHSKHSDDPVDPKGFRESDTLPYRGATMGRPRPRF